MLVHIILKIASNRLRTFRIPVHVSTSHFPGKICENYLGTRKELQFDSSWNIPPKVWRGTCTCTISPIQIQKGKEYKYLYNTYMMSSVLCPHLLSMYIVHMTSFYSFLLITQFLKNAFVTRSTTTYPKEKSEISGGLVLRTSARWSK
jgi:hypothetical protein